VSEHPSHSDSAPADPASTSTPTDQVSLTPEALAAGDQGKNELDSLFPDDTCWFMVRFHESPPRAQRTEFFERMAVHLSSHGLVMAELHGVCVLLAVERPMVPTDRHVVINWLIDEEVVGVVNLGPICSASDLYEGRVAGGNWYRKTKDKTKGKTGDQTPEEAQRFTRQRNASLHLILRSLLDRARLEYIGELLVQSELA